MKALAPIVLYTYNRPIHTERTLDALKKNTLAIESDLIVFSDGAKNDLDKSEVFKVRDLIKNINGFKSVKIVERPENFGLAKSIISGVTEILKSYENIIVLEDDLITHPQFLEYMNTALELYKNKKNVFSISGFSWIKSEKNVFQNEAYFLKSPSTWAWGTWSDKWSFFDNDTTDSVILDYDKNVRKSFNYDNSYPYYKMLKNRNNGKIKSWGIVWYWNIFKNNGLTLYPTETLIDQIGFDGSGQNAKNLILEENNIKLINYEFIFPTISEETNHYRLRVVKILKRRKVNILLNILKKIV